VPLITQFVIHAEHDRLACPASPFHSAAEPGFLEYVGNITAALFLFSRPRLYHINHYDLLLHTITTIIITLTRTLNNALNPSRTPH